MKSTLLKKKQQVNFNRALLKQNVRKIKFLRGIVSVFRTRLFFAKGRLKRFTLENKHIKGPNKQLELVALRRDILKLKRVLNPYQILLKAAEPFLDVKTGEIDFQLIETGVASNCVLMDF